MSTCAVVNWRRGLLRIWIVATVLWITAMLWLCWASRLEGTWSTPGARSDDYVTGRALGAEIFAARAFIPSGVAAGDRVYAGLGCSWLSRNGKGERALKPRSTVTLTGA